MRAREEDEGYIGSDEYHAQAWFDYAASGVNPEFTQQYVNSIILGIDPNNIEPPMPCDCLHGTPYIEAGVCKCSSTIEPPVILQPPVTIPTTTATIPIQFDLVNWLKANPLISLGGAAVVAYLLFFSGGNK
jgi:hypothetical protein